MRSEPADDLVGDAGLTRRARPRRDDDVARLQGGDLVGRDLVVAIDAHVDGCIQLAQTLHQVVGERIVVIDEQDHSIKRLAFPE